MNIADILDTASMPLASPSYPKGPYRFVDRQYMIISYESDPEAIRAAVPEPLEPDGSNQVLYEFIRMPDSTGFGDYTETGIVIPCRFRGAPVNFVAQMYLGHDEAVLRRELLAHLAHAERQFLVVRQKLRRQLRAEHHLDLRRVQ